MCEWYPALGNPILTVGKPLLYSLKSSFYVFFPSGSLRDDEMFVVVVLVHVQEIWHCTAVSVASEAQNRQGRCTPRPNSRRPRTVHYGNKLPLEKPL